MFILLGGVIVTGFASPPIPSRRLGRPRRPRVDGAVLGSTHLYDDANAPPRRRGTGGNVGRSRWLARFAVVVVVAALSLIAWPVAAVVLGLGVTWRRRTLRRRRDFTRKEIDADVSYVADLLAVGLGGGLTLANSISAIAGHIRGPVVAALVDAQERQALGLAYPLALDQTLASLGATAAILGELLRAHIEEGAPIVDRLGELAVEAREHRRRQGERDARRLPVLMLGPLVICVLPAFMLLSVVPVVYDALNGLAWR